jgi:uncharacterized protein YnzC (UPF0291/DUF896 family)
MTNSKLERINALARLAKERELTAQEMAERDALRREYIAEWRRGAEQVLENTYLVDEHGVKRKLPKKKDSHRRKPYADHLARRADVPEEFTWDLTALFPTLEDWTREYEELKALPAQIAALQGTLGRSAGPAARLAHAGRDQRAPGQAV